MEQKPCLYCGKNDFTEMTENRTASHDTTLIQPLCYVICTNCGTVNRVYMPNFPSYIFKNRQSDTNT